MGQDTTLWGRARCCPPAVPPDGPRTLPQDWPRQWKARLKRSPADLSLVTGLFSCLLRYCGAGRGLCLEPGGGAAACQYPPHPCPSASSFPEHPIAQLLRKLQCAVYTRLYPAVSQSSPEATPVASTGLAFLSLDAGGPLPAEPGGRRLRASRSLHCMFSVPEHGPAELRHSLSSAPLADSSTDAPGTEGEPQAPRESSFEDLERFLASPEDWSLGEPLAGPGQASSLQEQLKGVVRDIHNAIGEGGTGHAGGGWGLAVPSRASCVTPSFPDRLLSLTLLAFEGLNTAAGKDQCLACIEEAFFPPLWAPLLALYRYRSTGARLGAPVLAPPAPAVPSVCPQERAPAPRGGPGPQHGAAPQRQPR